MFNISGVIVRNKCWFYSDDSWLTINSTTINIISSDTTSTWCIQRIDTLSVATHARKLDEFNYTS